MNEFQSLELNDSRDTVVILLRSLVDLPEGGEHSHWSIGFCAFLPKSSS